MAAGLLKQYDWRNLKLETRETMSLRPETRAVHNSAIDPASGAIVPPITLSTTFEYETTGMEQDPDQLIYTRWQNPNRAALERTMAELEDGAVAHAISSGSAAMLTVFQALRPGDHIVSSDDMYFGIRVQLNEFLAPWGLETTYVDMSDQAALRAAMRPETKLVILETPTNPMIRLADIAAAAEIAHDYDAMLLVDNTVATPIAQNPIQLGADIVVISLTKYIAGHHDVLGGVIIFAQEDEYAARINRLGENRGAPSCRHSIAGWRCAACKACHIACAPTVRARCKSPVFWPSIPKSSACFTRTIRATRNTIWRGGKWNTAAA